MQTITEFYVQKATYRVVVDGVAIVLLVDYAHNSFTMVGAQSPQLATVATDLLAKKHGVNFAYKFNSSHDGRMEHI